MGIGIVEAPLLVRSNDFPINVSGEGSYFTCPVDLSGILVPNMTFDFRVKSSSFDGRYFDISAQELTIRLSRERVRSTSNLRIEVIVPESRNYGGAD